MACGTDCCDGRVCDSRRAGGGVVQKAVIYTCGDIYMRVVVRTAACARVAFSVTMRVRVVRRRRWFWRTKKS